MTEEKFIGLCRSKYQELAALDEVKDFYAYEKQFEKIMTELSQVLLQHTISEVPADRRKKKNFADTVKLR